MRSFLHPKNSMSTHPGVHQFFWVVATQISLVFIPNLGKSSNLANIFQMGWNHQLVLRCGNRQKISKNDVELFFRRRFIIPIGSMYGILTYIYHKNQPNVGKYTSPMDPMGHRDAWIVTRMHSEVIAVIFFSSCQALLDVPWRYTDFKDGCACQKGKNLCGCFQK